MESTEQIWKEQLIEVIHFLHQKGYAPATSSNYSFKIPGQDTITISSSGLDKGQIGVSDLMQVDADGNPWQDQRKPSAETLLHTMIYSVFPDVGCILHTHSVYNTILSRLLRADGVLKLKEYEILKGLSGIKTHEVTVEIPIFENTQDIPNLANLILHYLNGSSSCYGFLLVGHGMYTWGKSIEEAKRHVEVLEFLFECEYKMYQLTGLPTGFSRLNYAKLVQ